MEFDPMKTYGTITYSPDARHYLMDVVPHLRMRFKRFFHGIRQTLHVLVLSDTESNCEDLEMFISRWPLVSRDGSLDRIKQRAQESRTRLLECDDLLNRGSGIKPLPTLLPLRDYQLVGVSILKKRRRLLCGDDLGLGKSAIAIGAIADGASPAIIVCQNHLTKQWEDEVRKFLGNGINIHRQLTGKYKRMPDHQVLILPYSMLAKWVDHLAGYELIVFDEAQELRREESRRYESAAILSSRCNLVLALTATPIYNYGDEMFNVLNLVDRDVLGRRDEFLREWCVPAPGSHWKVANPEAFGSYLAENHLFLRRRRADVGRELPPLTRIVQDVVYDESRLAENADRAHQLARAILAQSSSFTERGQASRELSILLRQQTGLAKAPYVAEVVADLVNSGESVVLCGWHRDVYDIWQSEFQRLGIPFWLYTGSESPTQKDQAVKGFIASEAPGVFILSLRSGAGINGLQEKASLMVFGELDWSPKVQDQCVGRLRRDTLDPKPVTAIYLVANGGSDPIVASLLGLKREQSNGIVDLGIQTETTFEQDAEEGRGAALARFILKQKSA